MRRLGDIAKLRTFSRFEKMVGKFPAKSPGPPGTDNLMSDNK